VAKANLSFNILRQLKLTAIQKIKSTSHLNELPQALAKITEYVSGDLSRLVTNLYFCIKTMRS